MKELTRAFVTASQQLATAMMAQVQADDPELAAKVSHAVDNGETLVISCDFSDPPAVELVSRSDYTTTRRIGSIPLIMPAVN